MAGDSVYLSEADTAARAGLWWDGYSYGVAGGQTEDPTGCFLAPHVPLTPYVSIFTIIIRYMSDEGKSFRITSLLLRGRRLIVSVSSEKFPNTCIRISFLISYIPPTKHEPLPR